MRQTIFEEINWIETPELIYCVHNTCKEYPSKVSYSITLHCRHSICTLTYWILCLDLWTYMPKEQHATNFKDYCYRIYKEGLYFIVITMSVCSQFVVKWFHYLLHVHRWAWHRATTKIVVHLWFFFVLVLFLLPWKEIVKIHKFIISE